MVKSREEIVEQFHEEVNMTADELEKWLEDPKSTKAGTGVGIESGHKIVEILRKNPEKDPEKYDGADIEHMRKVVGYAKRHLAQEEHLKDTKTREELENTKSTISLKNWGHDPVKALDEEGEQAVEQPELDESSSPGENGKQTGEGDDSQDAKKTTGDQKNQKTTNKRKLDDDDAVAGNKESEVDAEPSADNTETAEVTLNGEDNGEGEGREEDRPRKKSKVVEE